MFKRSLIYNNNLIELSYPADKHTSFYVEGRRDFYSIIDVINADTKMFALLESNTLGEDDMVIIYLGHGEDTHAYILERYDHKSMDVNLSKRADRVIFINQDKIITDEVPGSLKETLEECEIINPEYHKIEEWTDEEINNESITQGGIIR